MKPENPANVQSPQKATMNTSSSLHPNTARLAPWFLACTLAATLALGADDPKPAAAPTPNADAPYQVLPPLEGDGWQYLFDGKSLAGWKVADFAGHGEVAIKDGQIRLDMGAMLTGVNLLRTNDIPKTGYEFALDAMKVDGSDFFCGLTFVVGDSCCSFIIGGWGGGLVGISSLDGMDASSNETTHFKDFEKGRWFRIRVRVTADKIEAWIGKEKMVDVKTKERRITVRPGEIETSQPFGIATYQTTAALRNIQWRRI
jgi:hypothetical protein